VEMLFHATNKEIGIINVVNKIKDKAIPSTPNQIFQLLHKENSDKH